jgi:anti-sigma factor RsiW
MTWHVAEEELRAYARGELAPPLLWSADTHVGSCAECRAVLAAVSDPAALDAGWDRLDAELDAARPGWVSPSTPRGCSPRPRCCAAPGWRLSRSCWR